MTKLLITILLVSLLGCTSTKQSNPTIETPSSPPKVLDVNFGKFNGTWIGEIKSVQGMGYPFVGEPAHSSFIMIAIQDDNISVSTSKDGVSFQEIKSNKYSIMKHKTNAIIYVQDSSEPGEWVETHNITLTQKDNSSIYVYFVRAVNSYTLEPELYKENKAGRYFLSYTGTLNLMVQIGETIELNDPDLAELLKKIK